MKISDLIIETFNGCIKGTIFSRQEIIKKVSEKFNVNTGSIIPSDYCYNRWNKGVSETKRLCLFEYIDTVDEKKYRYLGKDYSYNGKVYHKAKGDIEKCIGEWTDGVFNEYGIDKDVEEKSMFNKEILRKYVAEYKEKFMEIRFGKGHEEIYKWKAVEHFKKHWNIDAPNFSEMLKEAFSKTFNLLTTSMFFPVGMISQYADEEPDTVRNMFKNLYDESKDLNVRVYDFILQADELHEKYKKGNKHFQGTRSISVYLWLMYPDKYYIYQYGIYNNVVRILEANYKIKKDGKPETMIEGFKFYDEIRKELRNDKELMNLNLEHSIAGCKDESANTLTIDVGFYVSKIDNDIWEPSMDEYNPNITVEKWKELLDNQDVFDENSKKVVSGMLELGGRATCKQLADEFGDNYGFYNAVSVALAKRVHKATNCPMPPKKDEDAERYWPILYVGRNVKGEQGTFEWKLRNELREALENYGLPIEDKNGGKEKPMPKYSKNLILYGPPGTGKTYNTVNYAVAIIDNRKVDDVVKESKTPNGREKILARYNELKKEGLIDFCTFHQSFGYEEFIEGIKPKVDNGNVVYDVVPGIFKSFCTKTIVAAVGRDENFEIKDNPVIWKISLMNTGDNPVRKDCLENDHIRIGYGDDLSEQEINNSTKGILGRYVNDMQIGDVVVSCYTENEFDAVGVVTGDCQVDKKYSNFKQVRTVKWLVKNIKENIRSINDGKKMTLSTVYRLNSVTLADLLTVVKKYNKVESDNRNRVFIIDEINRGNISKIFGELITLIEDTKRIGEKEEMRVRLPYSPDEKFGVPNNVYLLGTMNTADRSIALIDTALRRRFKFIEMQPDTSLLKGIEVAGVNIQEMLAMINRRIEVLYDREHTIGHSFFMGLSNDSTIEDLAEVFECNVIPLLKEYFYDDFERIAAVLGDNLNQYDTSKNFISRQNNDYAKIFNSDITLMPAYKFNADALKNPEAYKKIYK